MSKKTSNYTVVLWTSDGFETSTYKSKKEAEDFIVRYVDENDLSSKDVTESVLVFKDATPVEVLAEDVRCNVWLN